MRRTDDHRVSTSHRSCRSTPFRRAITIIENTCRRREEALIYMTVSLNTDKWLLELTAWTIALIRAMTSRFLVGGSYSEWSSQAYCILVRASTTAVHARWTIWAKHLHKISLCKFVHNLKLIPNMLVFCWKCKYATGMELFFQDRHHRTVIWCVIHCNKANLVYGQYYKQQI
jgi:hypothetical protein